LQITVQILDEERTLYVFEPFLQGIGATYTARPKANWKDRSGLPIRVN